MTAPDETRLLAALEATWPPAAIDETSAPGWRLRDGAGAGKRVDSARSLGWSLETGDPSLFWCYQDEDFVGLLGKVAMSRGGKSLADTVPLRTMQRYKCLSS